MNFPKLSEISDYSGAREVENKYINSFLDKLDKQDTDLFRKELRGGRLDIMKGILSANPYQDLSTTNNLDVGLYKDYSLIKTLYQICLLMIIGRKPSGFGNVDDSKKHTQYKDPIYRVINKVAYAMISPAFKGMKESDNYSWLPLETKLRIEKLGLLSIQLKLDLDLLRLDFIEQEEIISSIHECFSCLEKARNTVFAIEDDLKSEGYKIVKSADEITKRLNESKQNKEYKSAYER